ncbi:MAG: folylpolyglutamate synthase/dihydrofolate synthase family protein [Weeksellaceae bacterium]|nr:folylpolyglutamate synthase/dihydrofolate synthase family protein [Weeksellaceae bacterium]
MTYEQTISWLFDIVPSFQDQGANAYNPGFEKIKPLLAAFGNPHEKIKTLHIAGTNGKGSTSHLLASVLQEAGYKTGLYTSPHLADFRERIRINGEMIALELVHEFLLDFKQNHLHLNPTFFELTTLLAFWHFEKSNVDIAVIETGLGGRLDATNIITPEVSIITNVALDHESILGDTLQQIAAEKAGIIKPKVPVVIGETQEDTAPIFIQTAKKLQAPVRFADQQPSNQHESALKGSYQRKNLQTAAIAVQVLREKDWNISEDHLRLGFENVLKNTGLRGRWEVISQQPKLVLDTAHNVAGVTELMKQIKVESFENLHLVLGFAGDKNVIEMLNLYPKVAHFYFCQPSVKRRFPVDKLRELVPNELHYSIYETVQEALLAAQSAAGKGDLILVGGSNFVVADAIAVLG